MFLLEKRLIRLVRRRGSTRCHEPYRRWLASIHVCPSKGWNDNIRRKIDAGWCEWHTIVWTAREIRLRFLTFRFRIWNSNHEPRGRAESKSCTASASEPKKSAQAYVPFPERATIGNLEKSILKITYDMSTFLVFACCTAYILLCILLAVYRDRSVTLRYL